ncbi:MAG: peptidylprolyl isomerase [Oscillospiraceae bacterium]
MVENWALSMNFYEEYVKRQAIIDKAIEDKKSEEELGAIAETLTQEMIAIQEAPITDEIIQKYMPVVEYYYTVGGTPHLDNIHTVFGYVINGIDVVDKIAEVEVIDTIDNKPKKDVIINSIKVKE